VRVLLFLLPCLLFGETHFVTNHMYGQLGNQLFQVAAAISYALDHGYEARFPKLPSYSNDQSYQIVFHRVNTAKFPKGTKFVTYKDMGSRFQPIPPPRGQNVRLEGFFQSDKYFHRHKDHIIHLFSPSRAVIQQLQDKYGPLLEKQTVAVHLRTFIPDVGHPDGGFHWNYFLAAMEYFPEESLFLIFADDMKWVKANFPKISRNCVFIEGNPAYLDFYLISLCQHQIVSPRSSFSWWAAYLNKNPNKIVLVPEKWTTNEDGIPEGWIRVRYLEN